MSEDQFAALCEMLAGLSYAAGLLSGLLSWGLLVLAKDHLTFWGRWND